MACGHFIASLTEQTARLKIGVTERVPMKSSGQLIPREITTIIASQVLSNASQREFSNGAYGPLARSARQLVSR